MHQINLKRKKPKRIPFFLKKQSLIQMPHQVIVFLYLTCEFFLNLMLKFRIYFFFFFRKDNDKIEKFKALREASKRVTLGAETLPSICCYTLLNANHTYVFKSPLIFLKFIFKNTIIDIFTIFTE